jgi:glucosamine-6-phosphate deaminase
MEVIIQENQKVASILGAKMISNQVRAKPESVLGLATGSTPLLLYKELIKLHNEVGLDFSKVTTYNLDEYVDLPASHSSSYSHFMKENLFQYINIPEYRIHVPDGLTPDIPAFCRQYEASIAASGGIDIQILGIGSDGHIGFNEPTSSLSSRTRIKTLTRQTIEDNRVYFDKSEKVPKHVITMGIGTIMESRKVILLAFGSKKAKVIKEMVEGPISSLIPASILQMHSSAVLLVDQEAAAKLEKKDYYQWVYENKPEWQKI